MGTNTIPAAQDNTTIEADHHNALRSSQIGDLVPRNAAGAPEDVAGSVGISAFRYLQGFIKTLFIGSVADNIELASDNGDFILKVGGNERFRVSKNVAPVPTATLVPYAGSVEPINQSEYLLCDGREVNRATYARLYAVIGNSAGHGNENDTFNLPDMRGESLRGVDAGKGRDPNAAARTAMNAGGNTGDAVLTVQEDAFQGHHFGASTDGTWTAAANAQALGGNADQSGGAGFAAKTLGDPVTDGTNGAPRIAAESRSKNISVNWLIKT